MPIGPTDLVDFATTEIERELQTVGGWITRNCSLGQAMAYFKWIEERGGRQNG